MAGGSRAGPVEYAIVTAGPEAAAALAALHAESWRSAYRGLVPDDFLGPGLDAQRRRAWKARFDAPDPDRRIVLSAVSPSGALLGFSCVLADAEPEFGPLLDNLHVRPDLRGGGIGAALLLRSRQWAQGVAPGRPMHLWVIEGNTAARRFYRAQGGVEGERRVQTMAGIEVVAVRVVWPQPP